MAATRRVRLERRPEARPTELLEAALHVFAQQGYRNARLDDVADAAGVTKGAIYHYFDTKEALLVRVIEHYQALAFGRAEDAVRDEHASAATRIRLLVRTLFAQRDVDTSGKWLRLLMRDVANEVPRVHRRWLRNGPVRLWTLIAALIDDGQKRGEFRRDADGEVGARMLVSGLMVQFAWQDYAADVPGLAIDDDRLIDGSTELLLASLRPAARR